MYIFEDVDGNVCIWRTTTTIGGGDDEDFCDEFEIKATIKDHREYNGVKQTIITRGSVTK